MTKPAAITGTYADLKSVKTRSVVQIVVECPIEMGEEIVAMFGFPQPGKEVPVAVARLISSSGSLTGKTSVSKTDDEGSSPSPQRQPKQRWDELPLSQQAAIRCNEPSFWRFLSEFFVTDIASAEDAAARVRADCNVKSRADIKPGKASGIEWSALESEYQAWLRAG